MFYSIIGWIGVVIFVLSYLFLSLGILSSDKTTYHWLNAVGAVCLVFNGLGIKDYPSLAVNAIWGVIALFTNIRLILKSNNFRELK